MKNFVVMFLVLACALTPALCQQQGAATKADVDKLLELTGARQRVLQVWQSMAQQAAISAARSYKKNIPMPLPRSWKGFPRRSHKGCRKAFRRFPSTN
jgi:hypothetical protein